MSRYIDAKNLTLIKNLANLISECEVIDIVFCKECKHIYTMDCAFYEVGDNVKPDDYCSYGEREGE